MKSTFYQLQFLHIRNASKKYILLIVFVLISITTNAQWLLTGNGGTNPLTDFVGTTDGAPLIFRIGGNQAGKLSFPLTSFGANSGLNLTTGNGNSFYGVGSGRFTNSGTSNCFFGDNAGSLNTSGNSNNYFGKDAGSSNTSGISNCFFGSSAGQNNTASNNSFFGHISGASNTTGTFNAFFGVSSGVLNTTGNNNSFYGGNSGFSNTTGSENTLFGFQSGQNTSSGFLISAFGSRAGNNNTTGQLNTFIGSSADCSTGNLFNATAIGADAVVSASNSMVLGNGVNVGIGVSAPSDKLHVVGNIRMVDGNQATGKVLTSDANGKATWQVIPPTTPTGTANGDLNGMYPNPTVDGLQGVAVSSTAPTTGQVLTFNGTQWNAAAPASVSPIGAANGDLNGTYPNPTVDALQGIAVSSTTPSPGQVLQYNGTSWTPAALPAASVDWKTTGNAGTNPAIQFIGTTDNVGLSIRTNNTEQMTIASTGGVAIGASSTGGNKLNVGGGDINITTANSYKIQGFEMMKLKSTSPCFGGSAGTSNTATNNLFVGTSAGFNNTSANFSTYIGNAAGFNNVTGAANVFIGYRSGFSSTGSGNTTIGEQAASNLATGDENLFVGRGTGNQITSGSFNTFIGSAVSSPATLTNGIGIGRGVSVMSDNCAVIGNGAVNKLGLGVTPAAGNIIQFAIGTTTAKLTTGGVWTNASDRKLKDNIQQLDKKEILEKINNLEVARWHYKADKEMKSYIGPFAKEFFTAFKTGDDSTISTIDPSGVALIGIQQLSIENKELKSEVENLKSEMAEIKKLLAENYFKNSFTVELKNENTNNVLFNAVPNPAGTNTTIKYEIVKPFHDAQILITDNTGAILLPIKLSRQMGEITINVASLHAGIYTYSLLVDGIKTDSKLFSVIK